MNVTELLILLISHFDSWRLHNLEKKNNYQIRYEIDELKYILYSLTIKIPTMSPKRPTALPKISTIKILTKRAGLAASARAAPEPIFPQILIFRNNPFKKKFQMKYHLPTIPTEIPQNRLTKPTVRPAPNMAYPEK